MKHFMQVFDKAVKEALFPSGQCNAEKFYDAPVGHVLVPVRFQCQLAPGHEGQHWCKAGTYGTIGIMPAPGPHPSLPEQRWDGDAWEDMCGASAEKWFAP